MWASMPKAIVSRDMRSSSRAAMEAEGHIALEREKNDQQLLVSLL